MDDYQSTLREPDAVLLRRGGDVRDQLKLHTVPLVFFPRSVDDGPPDSVGSGVLVRIEGRFFIFTAGHCVADASGAIAVGIRSERHRFVPNLEARGAFSSGGKDFGYFEVQAKEAMDMEAASKVFLGINQLAVQTASDLIAQNDWMVVAGFPLAEATEHGPEGYGATLVSYSTTLAGTGQAPVNTQMPIAPGTEAVDLWIPSTGNLTAHLSEMIERSVPSLSGASGGGCWRGGVRPDPENWEPNRMRLIGTHAATIINPFAGGKSDGACARAILIGYHLNQIKDDYPELRDAILARWPCVEDFQL